MTIALKRTSKMPSLFLGHGSPMNAIEENAFVQGFRQVASEVEQPSAILCVSAHWETRGTKVTAMEQPRTIHDFGGFPKALYEVQYRAPGHPELARSVQGMVKTNEVILDDQWGLDHGAWSVIKHMYPDAEVPVVQMSLNVNNSPQQHYETAKELAKLRERGVLIIGSGNLVHNLGMIEWRRLNEHYGFDWALEANDRIKQFITAGDHKQLIDFEKQGEAFRLAIPTAEHYLPLLYVMALQEDGEELTLFNDVPLGGSISMTSVKLG